MAQMFFEAVVLARRQLTPAMVRLTLGGPGLSHFATTGVPDEYLRLFFPHPDTGLLHLPHIDEAGRWTYPEGQDKLRYGTYTIRRFDPSTAQMDIDFVVHEGGVASAWAQQATPGQTIMVNRPRGLHTPPPDSVWQVLAADATGIPAIKRILEQSPDTVRSRVFIEVASQDHVQSLPSHPSLTATWLVGSGNGVAPSRLPEIISTMTLPQEPGYVWVAGEQKAVRAVRKHIRHTLKLPAERYCLVAYWIAQNESWAATFDALPASVRQAIDSVWESGRDAEIVRDEYEQTLEKFGL